MEVSEIKRRLNDLGLRPSRDRGQNFLLDDRVIEAALDAAGVAAGDRVLEIGPGLGVLTEALLSRGASVVAVELDRALADQLAERIRSDRLEIVVADFLELPADQLVERFSSGEYKVVANLPYSISSDALTRLLSVDPRPSGLTLMLQREVAERICAEPPRTGPLSVLAQVHGEPRIVRIVPPGAFWPPPKVESALLHVGLRSAEEVRVRLLGLDPESLMSVVRLGFSSRRRQLKNTLSGRFSPELLSAAFVESGIGPTDRPERLTVDMWIRLVVALTR
ncbi:MAG: 16S rRNA (adenine(1518)-N(6)/adenine(1519)-N(6))-dimethyltransferase RsmA [bacterium]